MSKALWQVLWVIAAHAFFSNPAHSTTHEFYRGKTIRIVVGYAAGGGYDTYSRACPAHGQTYPRKPNDFSRKHARCR